jgi:putative transposase
MAVIDCCTRKLVGVHVSRRGRAVEAEKALEMACLAEFGLLYAQGGARPVLRSDNGKVFTSRRFMGRCKQYGLSQEFITPYTPQQNGMIERFLRSLKEECVWLHNFEGLEDAKEAIYEWVAFYNKERPHQALGYLSPVEFEAQQSQLVA